MPSRTKAQKLFGAACLKVGLERGQVSRAAAIEIFRGTLEELGLTEGEVEDFLRAHREDVERAWERRDGSKGG